MNQQNGWHPYNPQSAESRRLENIALRQRMATALEAFERVAGIKTVEPHKETER